MMHWMLCFVFVCKTLRACWVCIHALPSCSLLITCTLKSKGVHLSAVAHTWLPTYVVRSGYEWNKIASSDSTGDRGVGQDKTILWTGISQLLPVQGHYLIEFFFLILLIKLSQHFYWGQRTTVQCIDMMPHSQSPQTCTGCDAVVGSPGATELPRALRRSLCPCKRKHPHLREVKTCWMSRAVTNLLFWLHSSSSSGRVAAILQCHFPIRLNHFAQAAWRQSQILFQKLPMLPAPFCPKTSICLARISLCSDSFNLDHFLGLFLWKSKRGLCRMRQEWAGSSTSPQK